LDVKDNDFKDDIRNSNKKAFIVWRVDKTLKDTVLGGLNFF